MAKKHDLSEQKNRLSNADLLKFVMACEDMELEMDIARALKEIVNEGKNSERIAAAELFLKYKYGYPKQRTDITSDGETLVVNFVTNGDK